MKEPYEKPTIESEDFSLEMMQATECTAAPLGEAYNVPNPAYASAPTCQGDCIRSDFTTS